MIGILLLLAGIGIVGYLLGYYMGSRTVEETEELEEEPEPPLRDDILKDRPQLVELKVKSSKDRSRPSGTIYEREPEKIDYSRGSDE